MGQGPGNSPVHRTGALRSMLLAVDTHIASGEIDLACTQLLNAYKKCDGEPKPPDFVAEPAALDLASMIQNLMDSLGCS